MADDTDILDELSAREPLFHRTELGTSRAWFEAETADDFWEVGASGAVYDREVVWATLAERYATGAPDAWAVGDWAVDDLAVRHLAGEVYVLTYRLHQGERVSRRSTVWERADGRWRALYHQGTLVSVPGSTVAP